MKEQAVVGRLLQNTTSIIGVVRVRCVTKLKLWNVHPISRPGSRGGGDRHTRLLYGRQVGRYGTVLYWYCTYPGLRRQVNKII